MEEILVKKAESGLKEVEIAKELGISKQAVSKALKEARAKLTQIFLSLSDILNSDSGSTACLTKTMIFIQ